MKLDTLGLLARMAYRNLFAARLKTAIVGSIVFFGALIVVLGHSLLDAVDAGMSRSIIGSVAGDCQVYSSKSKEKLELWGSFGGFPDIAPVEDYSRIKKTLLGVPNVKDVVPMGINGALVTSGNTIDLALEKLRNAVRAMQQHPGPAARAEYQSRKAHVRRIVGLLEKDLANLQEISGDAAATAEARRDVARANADGFWAGFDADPLAKLEILENKVAPQAPDADLLWISYIGTDPQQFTKSFDRMEIVEGTPIPPGKRGFLFAKWGYEENCKLKIARRLDKIKTALEAGGKRIAKDAELQRFVKENVAQVHEILYQLDPLKAKTATERLQKALKDPIGELEPMLATLLTVDDANFQERYAIFYRDVAPLIELYKIRVGDTLTIKAFTRSGYVQSVNVKVYGTFQFKGLETSSLAGSENLMDLVSFRELYGYLTADKLAEIEAMKKAAGAKTVSREHAEAELFGRADAPTQTTGGSGKAVTAEATPGIIKVPPRLTGEGRALRDAEIAARVYGPAELEHGVVLNAAVLLKDPRKLKVTMRAIAAAAKQDGLDLKVVSWQEAAGFMGQLVMLMRLVLYVAVSFIFLVAIIVLNNSMVMAALERVKDIGTLRAVGAQRPFIFAMILVEAAVIGVLFGGAGALAGGALVALIGHWGIPATSDVMFFFFSGPRLRPVPQPVAVAIAAVMVLVVNAVSAAYPAWIAMRVTPRQAMAAGDA